MSHLDIASRLRACIEAGDVDGVAALYHDDAVVWRNIDDRELSTRQMRKVIQFLATGVRNLRYENVRVRATEEGFVQQHVLCCTAASGEDVRAHACLVGTVRDGKLARLDEYLDSAAMAPLMKPA